MGDKKTYRGITYPQIFWWDWQFKIWKKIMCKRNIHLWDEALSGGPPYEHYLSCDACELMLHIDKFDDTYKE